MLCNECISNLHFDCEVKIKDEEGFIQEIFEMIKNLVEMIGKNGEKHKLGIDNSSYIYLLIAYI